MSEIDEREIDDFLVNWELEIRAGYTPADEIVGELYDRSLNFLHEASNESVEALQPRLIAYTEDRIAAEQTRELGWSELTKNDEVTAAFAELRSAGVVALECAGMTIQDGWGGVGLAQTTRDGGAVFFHQQDVIDALDGLGLLLAFGSFEQDPAREEQASSVIALQVLATLEKHGVAASWSGKTFQRIEIHPFEYRKRRWTAPPASPQIAPTFWQRTWRTGPEASAPLRDHQLGATKYEPLDEDAQDALAARFTQDVVALRTTAGFDSVLASDIRKAWLAFGSGQRGQVCHLGTPHVFLPAGSLTTMGPIDALRNLRAEAHVFRLHALAIKKGREER